MSPTVDRQGQRFQPPVTRIKSSLRIEVAEKKKPALMAHMNARLDKVI